MQKEYKKKSIQANLNQKKLTILFLTLPKWERAQRFTPQSELQEIKAFTLWQENAGDMDQERNIWPGSQNGCIFVKQSEESEIESANWLLALIFHCSNKNKV